MSNQMDKAAIRRQVLEKRNALSDTDREKASILLTERILGHQWYYMSDSILGFASYGSEIGTDTLLEEALHSGKKVYLPKVVGDQMLFYRVFTLDSLMEGYKGIKEPPGNTEVYEYCEKTASHTLMLMPGVAFDKQRNRIGYGKGFYDRYLADKEKLQLRTIAIGFQCQLVEAALSDRNDIKPYQVILF